jgi:SAM-dependent methyltransferase
LWTQIIISRIVQLMRHEEIWDDDAARRYDTPGSGMFAPDVLGPTVDRLAELAGKGRALEFAIGTGRVAIPLTERGVPVAGIEIAPAMIAQLRTKADETKIPVVPGDMTNATVPGTFSLVFLVFNGISNVLTQGEQVACFRNAARHLSPSGCFVIELWVPELRKMPMGQRAIACQSDPGYILVDTYDTLAQHVVSHHFKFGEGNDAELFRSPHRYVWPAELDLMAQLTGFELESRHADWTGSEFTAESRSHVSVYRLRDGR